MFLEGGKMIVISLGTNLGNRLDNLSRAINLMSERCLKNLKTSIILETEAIVPSDAPNNWNKPYLNMIAVGTTNLPPHNLLHELKKIEREIGRPKIYDRWSPRIIDLDILLYDDVLINEPDLTIPHKELYNRSFFLHLLALLNIFPWSEQREFKNTFTKTLTLYPKFVGIVNVTEDSFSDGGKYNYVEDACQQILKLSKDGASVIELGAQSTKDGATIVSESEEYKKLDDVLTEAEAFIGEHKIKVSIDTFRSEVALRLLKKHDISIINNVNGIFDEMSLRQIANSACNLCFVHSLDVPVVSNRVMESNSTLIRDLMSWQDMHIERLLSLGFDEERLIFDPGIGFGKTSYQCINILQNLAKLRSANCRLMVGHSRKSYMNTFSEEKIPVNRDIETIANSLSILDKVDFLRVHNVRDHMRAAVAYQSCQ